MSTKNINNEYNILKIYAYIFIISALIMGVFEIINYQSYGEAMSLVLSLDHLELICGLLLHMVTLISVFPLFRFVKRYKLQFGKDSRLQLLIVKKRIHIFFLVIIISEIIFTRFTGNGTALHRHTSTFLSIIFNFIKPACLFPIYYVFARDTKRKIYWLNIILFSYWRLIQGWSSFILLIATYEAYFFVKYSKHEHFFRFIYKNSVITSIFAIFLGAGLYQFVQPYKNWIRFGEFIPISYGTSLEKLVSRLNNFPITVLGIQNHAIIADLYRKQGIWNWEALTILRSLLPRALMPNKEYRPMSNLVLQSIMPTLSDQTGTGYNIFIYGFNLLEASAAGFMVWLVVYFVTAYLSIELIRLFENGSGDSDVLLFLFLFSVLYGGSIESVISYGYMGLIYTLPVMFLGGVIKIYRINEFKVSAK